jgi:hypothetical protein
VTRNTFIGVNIMDHLAPDCDADRSDVADRMIDAVRRSECGNDDAIADFA